MKPYLILPLLISLLLVCQSSGEESPVFIQQVGEFSIPDSKNRIVVTEEGDWIQFRIRGAGPMEPAIRKTSDWFIYILDKDHYWVHLGAGRLFYYSWQSDTHISFAEWTYPRMGNTQIPKPVENRMKKYSEQAAT